jgi:hypothetical protein
MAISKLPDSAQWKVDLMFEGLRYTQALGSAAQHAYPNFYPYRFAKDETNPTGSLQVPIPYLLKSDNETTLRIKGNSKSRWSVEGSREAGYELLNDSVSDRMPTDFVPMPDWMSQEIDGVPLAQNGVSLHSDMAVINVAPGCEYFLHKKGGKNLRCSFCAYGAPDERTKHLGQETNHIAIPETTLARMQQTLVAALKETEVRHIYLVGGSLPDWSDEGERFLQLARSVQEVVQHRIPVTLGSAALPLEILRQFKEEQLVDAVCFNLEVWSEDLFSKVCPGKNEFVGYSRWLESLENAVDIFGRNRVYSAMVAGIELEPDYEMSWEQASALAIEGAEALCSKGIIPIYSLYWPTGGQGHPEYLSRLRAFFETLNIAYYNIRQKYDLDIWEGFMCHKCAYMQLECDVDRATAVTGGNRG